MNIAKLATACLSGLSAVLLAACQSGQDPQADTGETVPAVLVNADAATMTALKAALGAAMNRANVELGPSDPTRSSSLTVLPPRPTDLEGRSLAQPTAFDLVTDGRACFLVRRDTGETTLLEGVDCRAL